MKKENFIISQNEDGTYQVADKKGRVFEWGKSVKYAYVSAYSPKYVRVYETDKLVTVYDMKGRMLEGTKDSQNVCIYEDGSYEVQKNGQEEYFDNGAKKRRRIKGIVAGLCALSLAMGINKCSTYHAQKKELEDQTPATYLGNWFAQGSQYLMFDTDGDFKTVEYYGYPGKMKDMGKVLQIQTHEKRLIGAWREMGLEIKSAEGMNVRN